MSSLYKVSGYTLLLLLIVVSLFHFLVLLQIIPYTIVWGGRLKTETDMYSFETISLLLNIFMIAVVLIKKGLLKINISHRIIDLLLWLMFLLFLLNTLGNFSAIHPFEKLVFTPLTLILSICSLILALEKKRPN